ncbi:SGNH hydrolase [Tersicoccus phoenicis]|uniref:SGNH hydrolase n=1 Tax=Tersicoccus phoenicis TaxID=554083 RepID=A0A1R1L8W1_9MICC|nr:SGNH/GDSL hydrolase family protein [Tersicoccus phoenicis]OMH23981.1 SGNH hydrolase [Tersicoccus phoenicis]
MHPWTRYVAIGDSFTEGIGDPEPSAQGGHRGWADRLAEELARTSHDFAYANLAVRGRLLDRIVAEQLEPALELKPDLVTVSAGGNDIIRRADPDAVAARLDGAVGRLADSGATVLLFTGPDIRDTPVLGAIRGRVAIFNENLHTVAKRHDAVIADMWALRELLQPQMWAPDRLHFSPLGHHTIAMMALDALNVPHEDLHPLEASPLPARTWRQARAEDLVWAREYFAPWVLRRLRRVSSGDHITAKRPMAGPVFGPGMPPGSE